MIFVTGGSGIVGSRLIFDLLQKGERVRALHRPGSDLVFARKVFEFYSPDEGRALFEKIEWVPGDLLDSDSLLEGMQNCQFVYHCAAMVSYNPSDREEMLLINAEGTANVVNAALDNKIEKICYVSSVAALGASKTKEPVTERDFWNSESSNSNYSLSKFMAERELWRGAAEGLPMVIVNPSVILGPAKYNQSSGMLFSTLKKGIPFYTSGAVGLVDVRDVSQIMIALMESSIEKERFILNSQTLSYHRLLSKAAEIFGNKAPAIKASPWMLRLAWRGIYLGSLFTGNKPSITKETAESSLRSREFSNDKIRKTLDHEFIEVEESLGYMGEFYM